MHWRFTRLDLKKTQGYYRKAAPDQAPASVENPVSITIDITKPQYTTVGIGLTTSLARKPLLGKKCRKALIKVYLAP